MQYWVVYAFLSVFESAINAVYWFRKSTASCEDDVSVSLTNTSLLLHLQVCSCVVDGSPANWVSLAAITFPLESVIDTKALVAPRSSSVPSFSRSSLASSLRAALPLPIFAPRLTRRPSLTPCKEPSLIFRSLSWNRWKRQYAASCYTGGCSNQHLGSVATGSGCVQWRSNARTWQIFSQAYDLVFHRMV